MQEAVFGGYGFVALRLVQAVAINLERRVHGRVTYAGFGTTLISQRQLVGRRGFFVRPVDLRGAVEHGLFAEKLIFFEFAFAENRFGQYAFRRGGGDDFRLVHIVAVGDFEFDVDAFVGNVHLRHERFFRRQQIVGVHSERAGTQGKKGGKEVKEFFHGVFSVEGLNRRIINAAAVYRP